MNSNSVKYFITLAEQLHFGRAADILYISQSTLSYHIQELENELGTKLFIRNKRKVLLSSAGAELLPLAKKFVDSGEELQQAALAASKKSPNIERLCLGLDNSFERFDLVGLPHAIAELRQKHKDISTNTELTDFYTLLAKTEIMTYDLSIGFLKNKETVSGILNIIPLFEEPFAVVHCLPNLEKSDWRKIISEHKILLTRDDSSWTDYIANRLSSEGIPSAPVLMKNFSDILTRVCLGEGVTVMPRIQAEKEAVTRPGMKVILIDIADFNMRLCAFWAKENYNYAITEIMGSLKISPDVLGRLW